MSSPPHPLCHFGMAGWFDIRETPTAYFEQKASAKSSNKEWPPKYWRFALTTKDGVEAAFTDRRRFGRVRLIDCAAEDMRKVSPLKENGPDPVIDKDVVTVEWLQNLCGSKRVPIKALLLDQANISGIGNWVGDESLYQARIHPEQYSNALSEGQIKKLHESLHYVCGFACDVLADSEKFPEHWLFKHRWGKGKKDSVDRLPSGEKIVYITVGGRTSAVVPSLQKKTGPVAGDVKAEDADDDEEEGGDRRKTGKAGKKRKAEAVDEDKVDGEELEQKPSRKGRKSNPRIPVTDTKAESSSQDGRTAKRSITKRQAETNGLSPKKPAARRGQANGEIDGEQASEERDEEEEEVSKPAKGRTGKKPKVAATSETPGTKPTTKAKGKKAEEAPAATGRRRSGRLSGR